MHSVCVSVWVGVTVNDMKIPSAAQQCLYGKIILLATTSQCLKEITFQPIGTLFTRYIRRLHYNKSMLVCTWPSKDVRFGYTNHHDRYVVAQFLSFSCAVVKHFTISDGINQL